MTKEKMKELLPVLQAWIDGKTVQYCFKGDWIDVVSLLSEAEHLDTFNFRIKPVPREFWIVTLEKRGVEYDTPVLVAYTSKPAGLSKQIHVREVLD